MYCEANSSEKLLLILINDGHPRLLASFPMARRRLVITLVNIRSRNLPVVPVKPSFLKACLNDTVDTGLLGPVDRPDSEGYGQGGKMHPRIVNIRRDGRENRKILPPPPLGASI